MSTISVTHVSAPIGGRHRRGRPGLIPVTTLAVVVRRGLLTWFRPGKHRRAAPRSNAGRTVRAPVPAAV